MTPQQHKADWWQRAQQQMSLQEISLSCEGEAGGRREREGEKYNQLRMVQVGMSLLREQSSHNKQRLPPSPTAPLPARVLGKREGGTSQGGSEHLPKIPLSP